MCVSVRHTHAQAYKWMERNAFSSSLGDWCVKMDYGTGCNHTMRSDFILLEINSQFIFTHHELVSQRAFFMQIIVERFTFDIIRSVGWIRSTYYNFNCIALHNIDKKWCDCLSRLYITVKLSNWILNALSLNTFLFKKMRSVFRLKCFHNRASSFHTYFIYINVVHSHSIFQNMQCIRIFKAPTQKHLLAWLPEFMAKLLEMSMCKLHT